MSENPVPSWEGETINPSDLDKPEYRGPGYDTPKARALRAGRPVITEVTTTPPRATSIVNVVVNNDK